MRRAFLLAAMATFAVAACDLAAVFGPAGGPYPESCAQLGFAARQCAAMVTEAKDIAGVTAADITSIDILPPRSDLAAGRGGSMIARVRLHLSSGSDRTEEIWCAGIVGGGDACNSDPTIGIAAGDVDHDVPCTGGGDPPAGCATLPPTPRPNIQALAQPLHVPVLDIPLDHLGHYEVEVGVAGLPDGAFSTSSASVLDQRPESFWIRDAALVIKPVDPSRPRVGSIYREPFDGVEPVRVTLVFDVTELSPGAVLQVRDIVVE